MKRIYQLLCLILLTTAAISCGGEDDSEDLTAGNRLGTGDSANDLLSDDIYKELVIEAVYVAGFRPEQESLDNLVDFLEERINKPSGIRILERDIPDQPYVDYSIAEVAQLESDFRTQFNDEDTIAVFVAFVENGSENDSGTSVVLGTAYRNTSLVMFQRTIESRSTQPTQPDRVDFETTVYNHEFGHLLGLVNLGSPPQSNHESSSNPRHCNVPGCLMFFEINGGDLTDMMNMTTIPELDPQCIADLQANGGR